jgi:hypothetical protein
MDEIIFAIGIILISAIVLVLGIKYDWPTS